MRVLKTSLHCLFWVNMLDDGTSGSNKLRISKQECTYGRLNGMHGVWIYCRTALIINLTIKQQQHTGSDGYKVIYNHQWNGIEKYTR
ncbi:hypothetical protein O0I10_000414 [Lichtheimia ornata]|uniref:Secreted protein n=1 Tax=Lichtheimia ornata TaxID=688661 RepID=A0AAD7Y5H0_9FUNG|nr:uncharacterized protein O0I10_000414 [Lichtheimia ornata]KAJ8664135.1 hypothetical protein O0I10_000414 [Lichtheimia ornata]